METLTCDECGGKVERKKLPYYKSGQHIGDYPMLICKKCKETTIEAEICGEIEKELKKRKLWGVKDRILLNEI
jgi:hypothetical protein